MNKPLTFYTERLMLATLDSSFAAVVCKYLTRSWPAVAQWMPLVHDDYFSTGYQRERMALEEELRGQDRLTRFYLFKRDDSDLRRPIGDLAFSNIVYGSFLSCTLGYKMDLTEANQGYMTEALRCALDFAFTSLQLHRVEANIMPHNIRSQRVVAKLGFTEEGLSRRYLKINGAWEDHLRYVIFSPYEV